MGDSCDIVIFLTLIVFVNLLKELALLIYCLLHKVTYTIPPAL